MKIFKIVYRRMNRFKKFFRFGGRHCVVLVVPEKGGVRRGKGPCNCLVKLKGGKKVVVPYGNLKFQFKR